MKVVKAALAVAVALSCNSLPAGAQSASTVLEQFGLVGVWALDCARPEFASNSVSRLPSGTMQMLGKTSPEWQPNVYIILAARRLSSDKIWLRVRLNEDSQQELEMVRQGTRLRTMSNRRPDGTYVAKDGIIVSGGTPTPWLERCR